MKEGRLDKDALKALAESEIEYAISLAGTGGVVRGMGGAAAPTQAVTIAESKEALIRSYMESGMSEATARQIVGRF